MMKRKMTLRCISIILCIVMILSSSNIVITAEELIGSSEITTESNQTNLGTSQNGLVEDVSMRDKFTKHYVDEDGTRYAVIFPEQVHYEDAGEMRRD